MKYLHSKLILSFESYPYSGLEEDLAEAIDKDFYESYKTWTLDNQNASSSQKVCVENKHKI